jgi:hypothetical protein
MSTERDPQPANDRPTEGGHDLRNLNLAPEDAGEPRSFVEAGSGGNANADAAPAASPSRHDGETDAPHARWADSQLAPDEKPDQLADKANESEDRQEALIDEGVEESFPASDPPSVKRIT